MFYDDVQYDKHGWRNRNLLQTAQGPIWITVPVLTKNQFGQKINETKINYESRWAVKILKTIQLNYSKWPYFKKYYSWLEERLLANWPTISELDIALTKDVANFYKWKTQFYLSSQLPIPSEVSRTLRLVKICKHLNSNHYLSGPSAKEYINADNQFINSGVDLEYIDYTFTNYPRPVSLEGSISIIDLLFSCDSDDQWI